MNVTVMSKGNEITTALTVLGEVPKPVHEDKKNEGIVEVDYELSSDEGEQPALRNPLSRVQLALRVEPTTTLIQEPSSHHERRSEDNTSDSELSITSDLIMKESLNAVEIAKPVLNVRDIMNIVENNETSTKTPRLNHNPQRAG
jgi:hypothetical protein